MALMPLPRTLTAQQGRLALTPSFGVTIAGLRDPRLDAAVDRMLRRVETKTGWTLDRTAAGTALRLHVKGAGEAVQSVDEDESYTLDVTQQGAEIEAATVVGAMRGMMTLVQMIESDPAGYFVPAVHIEDAPRFRWRGLMIDCGRHFEPITVLERTLDGMAEVKLNVFHWHLTEDQGFRIESRQFPRLTGDGSDGLFYTQDEARKLVAYARARGIRVVPEFDMPGHTTSWFVGYPELASGPGPYKVQRVFGIHDPAMDPTRESTYKFLDAFIGEMAEIFPDPYMHIGGDESNGSQWKANPKIVAFMQQHRFEDTSALQAYFNQRLLKILQKHGKKMVGWDEILNPALPKDVVVQSWRGEQSLAAGAKHGYQGILSAPYYLDAMHPAEWHYLADPIPADTKMTPEEQKLVLGGEACMWAEHLNQYSIDSRIWPRTAAIAERFWSPQDVRDVDAMYRRLHVESLRLETLGLTHLTHTEAALRTLASPQPDGSLAQFAALLEPVSFSERYEGQHTSQLTPLTHLVDAVRPDPPSRHTADLLTREFLKAPQSAAHQREHLERFYARASNSGLEVERLLKSKPLLAEALPRAQQLPLLAAAGTQAINLLATGGKAPAGWKAAQLALLAEAAKPGALVRYTFLDSLKQLVEAVPEQ